MFKRHNSYVLIALNKNRIAYRMHNGMEFATEYMKTLDH
jgi:hypothetical protein